MDSFASNSWRFIRRLAVAALVVKSALTINSSQVALLDGMMFGYSDLFLIGSVVASVAISVSILKHGL